MIADLHSHLIPGVDDGATSPEEAVSALRVLSEQFVGRAVVTPHVDGSLTLRADSLEARLAELDAGWSLLEKVAAEAGSQIELARGAEVMLDVPDPDLSDPRLRLAGTRFVLVEFPHMMIPPRSVQALFALIVRGHSPVVAHPERYSGLDVSLSVVEDWRRSGALLQVNAGSLLGRYGGRARAIAWRLVRRGWADYVASDYHARGACSLEQARAALVEAGGDEQARLLFETNPGRLLDGHPPEAVPALPEVRRGFLARMLGRGRR